MCRIRPELLAINCPAATILPRHGGCAQMIDLSPLVDAPGPRSLAYFDPAFPDRSLVLHAARPRDWHPDLPVVFVHHGVTRNGPDYRDYWLPHVDAGAMLAIAIEFPE